MKKFLVLALILGLAGFGCAQKSAVAPSDTQQSQAAQQGAKAGEPGKDADKLAGQQPEKVGSKDVSSDEAISGTGEVHGAFKDINFDFDKYDIRSDAKPALKSISDYFIKNKAQKLLVEGHCDERGTNEYNLGLGDRRAKATKDYLVSLGVSSSRIDVISYGEEKPLCKEQAEDCWAKNRRAHFVLLKGKR